MAPQADTPMAANVLGTIGTVSKCGISTKLMFDLFTNSLAAHSLWCVQLIPQIWTNWRTKKTDGLPGNMMFLGALSGVPFGVYSVAQNFNIPLQVQPQIFLTLCLVSWAQTLLYHRRWPTWRVWFTALIVASVFASVEAALILTLKPIYEAGNEAPILVVGIVAAVLLAAGLLPPYGEIWKRRGRVIGINWIFLSMDWLGAFFSLMALVAQETFDILGGVLYIVCCVLEIGIFLSHLVWLARTYKIRKIAAAHGKTFDDLAGEYEQSGIPFKFAQRKGREQGGHSKRKARETPSTTSAAAKESSTDRTTSLRDSQVPRMGCSLAEIADDRV